MLNNPNVQKETERHAYCIMAHNEPEILQSLVRMIDDERNDIFIHIDGKVDINKFTDVHAKKSTIIWTNRIKTYWGGPSMILATFVVLETAKNYGKYSYYHHISGVDLPIKTQDYIHKFCDCKNRGKEFLGLWPGTENSQDFKNQYMYYYLFDDMRMNKNYIIRKLAGCIRLFALWLQRKLGINRKFNYQIIAGCQYGSYSQKFVDYLIEHKYDIIRASRYMHVPDEKVIQSFFLASPFYQNYYNEPMEGNGIRKIKPGSPYLWNIKDYNELAKSPCLFARKFSSHDMQIVQKIERMVSSNNRE